MFGPHMHVGSSTASLYLAYHDPDTFLPVSINRVGGKPGLVESDLEGGLTLYHPSHSLVDGLEALDPDGVLIFTLNTALYESLDEIVKKWPTAWRFNTNLLELFIRPEKRDVIPHILNMPSKVDALITCTGEVEDDLNRLGWRNTTTINTCLDTSEFEPSEPDGNIVVSMTRISPIKNFIIGLFAMRSVTQRDLSARYEIYGSGELTEYIQQVVELTRSERISYEGYEEADEILSRAKVLLQLSISENQSLAPLEALSAGVPCVCSDISGHPKSAVRVPHDSINRTAHAVEELLEDDGYWEEKREEGLKEARDHDVRKVAPQYVSLFEKLMRLR